MDKQIIERLKTNLDFERTKRKSLQADLKAKEKECEELKNTITNLENIRDEFSAKLDQLKAKNEELKKNLNEGCLQHLTLMTEQQVLLKTLAEIKKIISECEVKNE